MAKFDEREGNSCHIHLSVRGGDGEPVFDEAFLAGQLACLRELTLFYAPNINSYKRFVEGSFAPTAVAWGNDNRTCALRVVGHGAVAGGSSCGSPGADVNPYLALSAMIAAGLHGIEQGLELEPPLEGNAYDVRQAARAGDAARGARPLRRRARWRARRSATRSSTTTSTTRDVELDAFDARGHRLGALPGVRAAVTVLDFRPPASVQSAIGRTEQTFPMRG